MTISRITIAQVHFYDSDKVQNLLKEYNIPRHNVISIVHSESAVYLYYWTQL